MGRKRLAKAIKLLDFRMDATMTHLQNSRIEDMLKATAIRETGASVRTTIPCPRRDETTLSTFVTVLLMWRSLNICSLGKRFNWQKRDRGITGKMDEGPINAIRICRKFLMLLFRQMSTALSQRSAVVFAMQMIGQLVDFQPLLGWKCISYLNCQGIGRTAIFVA